MQMERTIYLVDDDEDDRMFISGAIHQVLDRVNVIEFDNGIDFLQLMASLPLSQESAIILMDINMPRMSGMEVISALKANLDHRHLPILVISTATDTRLIDKIITNGASGYFAKPGNLEEIQQLALNIKDFYVKHYPSVN